jgi:cathepsin L
MMACSRAVFWAAVLLAVSGGADAVALRGPGSAGAAKVGRPDPRGYSFAQFTKDFQRSYAVGSEEYHRRAALFDASLARVGAKNAQEGRSWSAGVNEFMDWTVHERKALAGGYKPARRNSAGAAMAGLQTRGQGREGRSAARLNMSWGGSGSFSWNDQGVGPSIRQQGNCGSCWAISAVEAVEAQLQKNGAGADVRLSAQALVDCVPNPQHCGGSGGCDGATGELAYSFMRDVGLPLDADHHYTARTGKCPMVSDDISAKTAWPSQTRARVSGWNQLPSNQGKPVMEALVQEGPVVIAVDADNWFDYDHGVFDGCDKDATLGHAVLLKGYGQDGDQKYWQIQNSWGADWGESGFIRILRHEDEDSHCGTDKKPSEGVGCDGGPSEVTVCGTCGLLFDPIVPQGVTLEGAVAGSAPAGGLPDGASQTQKMEALMAYKPFEP